MSMKRKKRKEKLDSLFYAVKSSKLFYVVLFLFFSLSMVFLKFYKTQKHVAFRKVQVLEKTSSYFTLLEAQKEPFSVLLHSEKTMPFLEVIWTLPYPKGISKRKIDFLKKWFHLFWTKVFPKPSSVSFETEAGADRFYFYFQALSKDKVLLLKAIEKFFFQGLRLKESFQYLFNLLSVKEKKYAQERKNAKEKKYMRKKNEKTPKGAVGKKAQEQVIYAWRSLWEETSQIGEGGVKELFSFKRFRKVLISLFSSQNQVVFFSGTWGLKAVERFLKKIESFWHQHAVRFKKNTALVQKKKRKKELVRVLRQRGSAQVQVHFGWELGGSFAERSLLRILLFSSSFGVCSLFLEKQLGLAYGMQSNLERVRGKTVLHVSLWTVAKKLPRLMKKFFEKLRWISKNSFRGGESLVRKKHFLRSSWFLERILSAQLLFLTWEQMYSERLFKRQVQSMGPFVWKAIDLRKTFEQALSGVSLTKVHQLFQHDLVQKKPHVLIIGDLSSSILKKSVSRFQWVFKRDGI